MPSKVNCIIPLINFTTEIQELSLGNIKIREIRPDDSKNIKDTVKENIIIQHGVHKQNFLDDKDFLLKNGLLFLIEYPCILNLSEKIDETKCSKKAENILLILHLFKNGYIGTNHFLINILGSNDVWLWLPFQEFKINESKPQYYLSKNESDEFKKFYNDIEKYIQNWNGLSNRSLRWFNKYYTEIHEEDKLIDLIIASEALYKIGSHKLPFRTSYNIGKSSDDRIQIYQTMEKAMDIRNKIIHGSSFNGQKIEQITKDLEQYVRTSLIKLLKITNYDNFIKSLDIKIAKGETL